MESAAADTLMNLIISPSPLHLVPPSVSVFHTLCVQQLSPASIDSQQPFNHNKEHMNFTCLSNNSAPLTQGSHRLQLEMLLVMSLKPVSLDRCLVLTKVYPTLPVGGDYFFPSPLENRLFQMSNQCTKTHGQKQSQTVVKNTR